MTAWIDLYWIPLGAGGWFVRANGRIYERLRARREHRRALDLYHTALEVQLPHARYVIENAWPIPDRDGRARGVVREGPVFARPLANVRILRYEIRAWKDGAIPDARYAGAPDRVTESIEVAARAVPLARRVPPLVWGRDGSGVGEMWNSNSVIAWILRRAGVRMEAIRPPPGGAAPGWRAGIVVADRKTAVSTGGRHPSPLASRRPRRPRWRATRASNSSEPPAP